MRTVAVALVAGLVSCSASEPTGVDPSPGTVEGVRIAVSDGRSLDLWFVRPDSAAPAGPHPLIVAFPWGGGTPDLAFGMLRTYWDTEPSLRGYAVVAPAARGSDLGGDTTLVTAILDWAMDEFEVDTERVVFVGASNGGRGVFFAQEVSPIQPAALIAMPGAILPGTSLEALNGRPVRLMVGEQDAPWRDAADQAEPLLAAAGASVQLDVLAGQGHVLNVPQADLADWLDAALGR